MRTWIEVNSQAFAYNTTQIKNIIGTTQLALVVKSNAYGHGLKEIALLAQQSTSIEWLCTASLHEALILHSHGVMKPTIALSYLDDDYEAAITKNIHCAIYDYTTAYALHYAAQHLGKKAYVHIKIDTGMSRLGITPADALDFIKALQQLSGIIIYGIFTHLSDTTNQNQSFSYLQLERFDNLLDQLKKAQIDIPCTHALSSSGLAVLPKRQYTLLRAGAAMYGIIKSLEHQELIRRHFPTFDIQAIMQWKTRIIQVKNIDLGSYIGYNNSFKAKQPMRIGVLPIGYWDGLPRSLSNIGNVMIKGKLAPIVGMVSMNLVSVDITHIPQAAVNDEVILIGNQSSLTSLDCAQRINTIGNEIITRINQGIARIIVNQDSLFDIQKYPIKNNHLNLLEGTLDVPS